MSLAYDYLSFYWQMAFWLPALAVFLWLFFCDFFILSEAVISLGAISAQQVTQDDFQDPHWGWTFDGKKNNNKSVN